MNGNFVPLLIPHALMIVLIFQRTVNMFNMYSHTDLQEVSLRVLCMMVGRGRWWRVSCTVPLTVRKYQTNV